MSKTVEITSSEQFSDILSKSRIVVADCKLSPFQPKTQPYPATPVFSTTVT